MGNKGTPKFQVVGAVPARSKRSTAATKRAIRSLDARTTDKPVRNIKADRPRQVVS